MEPEEDSVICLNQMRLRDDIAAKTSIQ